MVGSIFPPVWKVKSLHKKRSYSGGRFCKKEFTPWIESQVEVFNGWASSLYYLQVAEDFDHITKSGGFDFSFVNARSGREADSSSAPSS